MTVAKIATLSLAVFGMTVLSGCLSTTEEAADAALQGTWSTSEEEYGATVAMTMVFDNGSWEFKTSFEPSQELIDSLDAMKEETDTATSDEADVDSDETTTDTTEEVPELKAEALTITANYTVDSVENNVYQLSLTNFGADATDEALLQDFDTAQMETEMGKMTVDVSVENEMTVTPEGGSASDALTLTKE